ncbi:hypothetical protein PybrP1_004625 [[Pythium] brassicae (nom. inval.)]|nr:hypothetical protein PybrP1_004625 [[Pythium] brassicae (nom. inval.)]
MGDSDLWRADGSFRGIQSGGGGGGGKGKGKGGGAPQFTRVIPKFLQKYHQENPPEIQAKFAPPTMPGDDGVAEEELDDVQKAAIAEFLEKDRAKKDAGGEGGEAPGNSSTDADTRPNKSAQAVAGVGSAKRKQDKEEQRQAKTKRKRPEVATLSNKKLLSFSMDDDE